MLQILQSLAREKKSETKTAGTKYNTETSANDKLLPRTLECCCWNTADGNKTADEETTAIEGDKIAVRRGNTATEWPKLLFKKPRLRGREIGNGDTTTAIEAKTTANEWKTTEIEGKKTAVGGELSAIEGKKRAIDKTAFEEKTTTGDE